jgi:hypothetical protein
VAKRRKLSQDQYVARARAIHGDRYGYEKCKYEGMNWHVTITCPVHGDVELLAGNHIYQRSGCPKCAAEDPNYERPPKPTKRPSSKLPDLIAYRSPVVAFEDGSALIRTLAISCGMEGQPKEFMKGVVAALHRSKFFEESTDA